MIAWVRVRVRVRVSPALVRGCYTPLLLALCVRLLLCRLFRAPFVQLRIVLCTISFSQHIPGSMVCYMHHAHERSLPTIVPGSLK